MHLIHSRSDKTISDVTRDERVQNPETTRASCPAASEYAWDQCDMSGSCAAAPLSVAAGVNSVALLIMSSPTACQPDINQRRRRGGDKLTNQAEQTEDAAKHLHDEDLHEQRRIRGVSQSCRRAGDAHGDTAKQITDAHSQAAPEERITCQALAWVHDSEG